MAEALTYFNGGSGKDLFVYLSPEDGGDTIKSFSVKDDTIAISASGFGGKLVAGQSLVAGTTFISNTSPHAPTSSGTFLYDSSNHDLFWDGDGSGAADPVKLAHFDSTVLLKADDFKIIA